MSMGSYILFAWRDAMALASLLEDNFDVAEVRRAFEKMSFDEKMDYQFKNSELIQELIRRPESQRLAYIKRVGKNSDDLGKGIFAVFAVIGQTHVMKTMELVDLYAGALSPGSGNRTTCARLYQFKQRSDEICNYDWPSEVFYAYGGDPGFGDEDEDEDEERG